MVFYENNSNWTRDDNLNQLLITFCCYIAVYNYGGPEKFYYHSQLDAQSCEAAHFIFNALPTAVVEIENIYIYAHFVN